MYNDDLVLILEASEGTSVANQLENILIKGESLEDQNPNALKIISRFLKKYYKKYFRYDSDDVEDCDEWIELSKRIDKYLTEEN